MLVAEGTINHCTWRSHGNALVFDDDQARRRFLALLRKHKEKHGVEIHSYCLMGTHPHVICKATLGQKAFSAFWKVVNHGFACWFNRRTKGRGQVVRDRVRSPQIQDGRHQLEAMRYGDMNPVRANVVRSPKDWPWSSFRHYAYGEENDLITDTPQYMALGNTPVARRKAYLHLFAGRFLELLLLRRSRELVEAHFIGEDDWKAKRLAACGLSPPG